MASVTNDPETFQHYQVMRREDGSLWELGRGAMGVTYKAFDMNLRAPVALKVINALHLDSETSRARFVREARAAAGLRHRNVASVYHLGHDDQSFFYAMEFVDGDTVEGLVKRQGVLKPVTALQIALQVSRALGAANKQQLVHRDIKPANLMVVAEDDEEDQFAVKVIDFGLARPALGGEGSAHITMGGFVGTPQYASPEQLEEKELDARSDIYSLGITLWYMLAGRPPFAGALGSVFIQQLTKEPPWDHLTGTPKPVTDLLALMLAKDPDKRPQSPTELRRAIEACLKKLPSESGRITIPHGATTSGEVPTVSLDSSTPTRQTLLDTATPLTTIPTGIGPTVTSAATSAPATGMILAGKYALDFQAGEGGNGRVFRARDIDQGNAVVAVKIFHRSVLESPAELSRLESSLQKLQSSPHPHLLRFQSFQRTGEVKYLIGEWVKGFNLVELLRARGKLPPREVFSLLSQAAAAADHAKSTQLPGPELALHQILVDFPTEPLENDSASDSASGTRTLLGLTLDRWPQFSLKLDATGILRQAGDSVTLTGDMTMLPGRQTLDRDTQSSIRGLIADSHVFSLALLAYELLNGAPPASSPREEGRDSKYVAVAALNEQGNALLRKALSPNPGFSASSEFIRELAEASGFGAELARLGIATAVSTDASDADSQAAETLAFGSHAMPSWAQGEAGDSSAATMVHHDEPSSKDDFQEGMVTARAAGNMPPVPEAETPSTGEMDGSEAATLQDYSFVSRGADTFLPEEVDPADARNPEVVKDDYGADDSDAPTLQGYSFKAPPGTEEIVRAPLVEVVRDTYGSDEEETTPRKATEPIEGSVVDAPTLQGYSFKTGGFVGIELPDAVRSDASGKSLSDHPDPAPLEAEAATLAGYDFKADPANTTLPDEDEKESSRSSPPTGKTPAEESSDPEAAATLLDVSFKDAPKETVTAAGEDHEAATLVDAISLVKDEPAVAKAPEPLDLKDEFLTVSDTSLTAPPPEPAKTGVRVSEAKSPADDAPRIDQAAVSLDEPVEEPAPLSKVPVPEIRAETARPGRTPDVVHERKTEPVFTGRQLEESTPKKPNFALIGIVAAVLVLGSVGALIGMRGKSSQPVPEPNPSRKVSKLPDPAPRDSGGSTPPLVQPTPEPAIVLATQPTPLPVSSPSTPATGTNADGNATPAPTPEPTPVLASGNTTNNTRVNPSGTPAATARPGSRRDDDDDADDKPDSRRRSGDDNRRRDQPSTPRPATVSREPKPTPERVIKREPVKSEPHPVKQATPKPAPPPENRPRGPAVPFMR